MLRLAMDLRYQSGVQSSSHRLRGPPSKASQTFPASPDPSENGLKIARFTNYGKINYFQNSESSYRDISRHFQTFSDISGGDLLWLRFVWISSIQHRAVANGKMI